MKETDYHPPTAHQQPTPPPTALQVDRKVMKELEQQPTEGVRDNLQRIPTQDVTPQSIHEHSMANKNIKYHHERQNESMIRNSEQNYEDEHDIIQENTQQLLQLFGSESFKPQRPHQYYLYSQYQYQHPSSPMQTTQLFYSNRFIQFNHQQLSKLFGEYYQPQKPPQYWLYSSQQQAPKLEYIFRYEPTVHLNQPDELQDLSLQPHNNNNCSNINHVNGLEQDLQRQYHPLYYNQPREMQELAVQPQHLHEPLKLV